MKQEFIIHPRVKVVVYDGQPPHPKRIHWGVLVDEGTVWHKSLTANRADLLKLAQWIAQQEVYKLKEPP